MNKVVSRETALERVKSGQTLMVGDFLATGTPEYLIDGVMERDISALTMISCTTGMPDKGCGKLIVGKRVKKVITSHIGTNPETGRQMMAGELEVELDVYKRQAKNRAIPLRFILVFLLAAAAGPLDRAGGSRVLRFRSSPAARFAEAQRGPCGQRYP